MKTNRFTFLTTAAFGIAAFSTGGCTAKDQTAPPTSVMPAPSSTAQVAATAAPDLGSARWIDVKDYDYDQRALFFERLTRLEARVDAQIKELTAQRAAMKGNADTKAWDFAMKEMGDARSYLKSMGEEARKATAETWDQKKEKVGQAWVRTQAAYDKVKSSTTG